MKVLRFTASWCGPCRIYKPVFDEIQKEMADSGAIFETIDVDNDTENLSEQFKVRSIPTTVFLKGDEVELSVTGPMKKSDLKDAVAALL